MSAHALSFDTLKFAKKLEAYTFTTKQSEGLAEELKTIIQNNTEILSNETATKKDIIKLEKAISETKLEIIKWFISAMIAQSAIIISILKFL